MQIIARAAHAVEDGKALPGGGQARGQSRAVAAWEGFTILYRVGGASYYLHAARDALFATLDGERSDDGWITLRDDGKTHEARFPGK